MIEEGVWSAQGKNGYLFDIMCYTHTLVGNASAWEFPLNYQ